MRSGFIALTCLLVASGTAFAQTQPSAAMRQGVAGVVKSVSATDLVLTTANGDVDISITPQTRVLAREGAAVSDIQPGTYLGTSNHTAADGTSNTATEVHVMANGPNVNYAMDPANDPSLMMTNGHVTAVQNTAKGTEMDVDYGQGAPRHVIVNGDTSMTRMNDVGVAGLHAGLQVNARTSTDAQGHQTALFVAIAAPAAGH